MSLPLRECGLKSYALNNTINSNFVTPLAGVWIEILTVGKYPTDLTVTPLAGVWIEIKRDGLARKSHQSHSPCGSVD